MAVIEKLPSPNPKDYASLSDWILSAKQLKSRVDDEAIRCVIESSELDRLRNSDTDSTTETDIRHSRSLP